MNTQDTVPVLIVGAGPVGAVLALELAYRDVPSVVIERSLTPSRHPKMDFISGRSMELLRRLGISQAVRDQGIDAHHAADFLWTRGFHEPPVAMWHWPSPAAVRAADAEVDDGSAPAEVYVRVQGSLLEEVLRDLVRRHPLIELREGWTFSSLRQAHDHVLVDVMNAADRERHTVRAGYVVGCDGARSAVRQSLGIGVSRTGPSTQHVSVYFRSSDPALRMYGRAFVTIVSRGMTLVSRDEDEWWTASIRLADGETFTGDPVAELRARLGVDFRVDEVVGVTQWEGSLAVTDAYRSGSVFLAGDAAHQFYPTGGHGANTGLADAVDLGWKLAATLGGWSGPGLLDSYQAERRQAALFYREMCANLLEVWQRFTRMANLGASRAHLAGYLEQEAYQIRNAGVHFGYRYQDSPVIWPEAGEPPAWHWDRVRPTTWPGGRAPAVRLPDGANVHDRLGPGFTLVDLSGEGLGKPLVDAALQAGVPMTRLESTGPAVREAWERSLVLVRPDHHVAWRGDAAPADWAHVLKKVTGHPVPIGRGST